jgi:hypothetical protein
MGWRPICRWWRPSCRSRLACRTGRRRPTHHGGLVPAAASLGQADLALPVVVYGLGMQPPVLERLGGPIQHRACFLEGGHTVLGDDLPGDRATDGGPGRCLGRRTWLGVLVLEQQPAKRDSNKCRNEKGEPDAPAVVAADGPQLRAGQPIGGLRHLGTSLPGAVLTGARQ